MLPDEFCHLAAQAMCCHLASVVAPPRLDVPAEGVTRALIALFAGKILVAIAQVNTCSSSCFPFVGVRPVICHSAVRLLLGPFKCYVTQWRVGGCQLFQEKVLRRCTVQRY